MRSKRTRPTASGERNDGVRTIKFPPTRFIKWETVLPSLTLTDVIDANTKAAPLPGESELPQAAGERIPQGRQGRCTVGARATLSPRPCLTCRAFTGAL